MPTTSHAYHCTGCNQVTSFRLSTGFIPYAHWYLTCRKCHRYSLHHLIIKTLDEAPLLLHL